MVQTVPVFFEALSHLSTVSMKLLIYNGNLRITNYGSELFYVHLCQYTPQGVSAYKKVVTYISKCFLFLRFKSTKYHYLL